MIGLGDELGTQCNLNYRRDSMIRSTWVLLLIGLVAGGGYLLAATDAEMQSMRGLDSLKVVVGTRSEKDEKLGLSREAMQTIAEAHLDQQYHIKLSDDSPVFVYIKCRVVGPSRGIVAYSLSVEVRQMVTLTRDENLSLVTVTWEAGGTFMTSGRKFPQSLQRELPALLDKLGYDFLQANAGRAQD